MDFATIWAMLQPFLPLLAPLVVAALKKFAPSLIEAFPPWAKPLASAVIGMLIAWLSGLAGEPAAMGAIASGAALGLAGSKVRDLAVRKPSACATPPFAGGNEGDVTTAGVRG